MDLSGSSCDKFYEMKLLVRKERSLENLADCSTFPKNPMRNCCSTEFLDWSDFQRVSMFIDSDQENSYHIRRNRVSTRNEHVNMQENYRNESSENDWTDFDNNNVGDNINNDTNKSNTRLKSPFIKARKLLQNHKLPSIRRSSKRKTITTETSSSESENNEQMLIKKTENEYETLDVNKTITFVLTKRFIGWKV